MLALDTLISGLVKGRRVFSTDKLYKKFLKVDISSGIDQLKPVGLWYSIEDSWFNWCSFEKHNDGIKKYICQLPHTKVTGLAQSILEIESIRVLALLR
jgi:hypothetical protein